MRIAFCLVLTGCSITPFDPDLHVESPFALDDRLPLFSYESFPSDAVTERRENDEWILEGPDGVWIAHVRKPASSPSCAILILPILGGKYTITRHFAEVFCERGLTTIWVERRGKLMDPSRDLEASKQAFVEQVVDARRALDWLDHQNDVIGNGYGLFGISRGGIVGSLVAAIDTRIGASVIAIAGGDLPTIVEESTEKEVVRFRDAQVRRSGYSFDVFRKRARQVFHDVDPLHYAARIEPSTCLMIAARFDSVIPPQCTNALWQRAGRPRLITFDATHTGIFVFIPYCEKVAAEHYVDVLLDDPG